VSNPTEFSRSPTTRRATAKRSERELPTSAATPSPFERYIRSADRVYINSVPFAPHSLSLTLYLFFSLRLEKHSHVKRRFFFFPKRLAIERTCTTFSVRLYLCFFARSTARTTRSVSRRTIHNTIRNNCIYRAYLHRIIVDKYIKCRVIDTYRDVGALGSQ